MDLEADAVSSSLCSSTGKLDSILLGLNPAPPPAPMSSQGLPLSQLQFLGVTDLGMALPNASQVNLQDASKLISS